MYSVHDLYEMTPESTMKSSSRLISATLLGISLLLSLSGTADAGRWVVPLPGNAYQTSPEPSPVHRRSRESIELEQADGIYQAYFHVDRGCRLSLSVETQTRAESRLHVTCAEASFRATIPPGEHTSDLGTVQIPQNQYVAVKFQLPAESRPIQISNLIVESETPDLNLAFVKSNEGNMYYWGRRGPSVHLRYAVPKDVSLRYAYSELTIPSGQDPIGSYFMANGFGQGYFGIQVNGPQERRVLFSVWSPHKTDDPREIPEDQRIRTLARGKDVTIKEFGNEGSGGQSYLVYPWKSETTYRFLTEVRPNGDGRTNYTCWFGPKPIPGETIPDEPNRWRLIASFERPMTDTNLSGFHSFLENFNPATGHLTRSVRYSNVWVCDVDGRWHECTEARFSTDATGSGRHRLDFAGGSDGDHFFLRNCGFFRENTPPGETFQRRSSGGVPPDVDLSNLPRGSID